MLILGISAFYHDSAAALVENGNIVCAIQEERFTRIKHDPCFPIESINYCLDERSIKIKDIDNIVFYEKPFIKFERILETYIAFAPRGFRSFNSSLSSWIKDKLFLKENIIKELNKSFNLDKETLKNKILFSDHHLSHSASAFFPSPFERAAILTMDGVGEWATTSIAIGNNNSIKTLKEINFPHSIGLLYSAFTYYLGFKVNSGEYKVMGLAPYGEPKYIHKIKDNLIKISEDGSFLLNLNYFDYPTGLKMTNDNFNKLFGGPPRRPESKIEQKHMDIAASIQKVTEEIVIKICNYISKETGEKNLCLAGGVALNCVSNGKIIEKKIFDNIWIQPASGDSGGSLGAALAAYFMHHKKDRVFNRKDNMKGSYLGPKYSDDEIENILSDCGAIYKRLDQKKIINYTVSALCNQLAVGWMQGRMEFGPRALGNRSIIADPRSSKMQKILNLKVKFRESFRPFAPSILNEYLKDWFEIDTTSPYMLLVSKIKENKKIIKKENEFFFGFDKLNIQRSEIPAVTHVDYSARIQTVHKDTNPLYHELISAFYKKTNVPILVNTSFNVRGEPIVCSPEDAFRCFMGTELDVLIIGNFFLLKEEQDPSLKKKYNFEYNLD